jgi:hypothetical protein
MATLSDFEILAVTPGVVAIADLDAGRRSVTNDADNVVADLHQRGLLKGRRLIYRDSEGRWDELGHDENGRFIGFKFLGGNSLRDALAMCAAEAT